MSGGSGTGGREPRCPECGAALQPLPIGPQEGGPRGVGCPAGHGTAATLASARATVDERVVNQLWGKAYGAPSGTRPCPYCKNAMVSVAWVLGEGETAHEVVLDVCRADQLLWLDAGEVESLPRAVAKEPGRTPLSEIQTGWEILNIRVDRWWI